MSENDNHHVAGIIATNSQPMDFNFPWADCLQPIAPNFLSIERAVLECACAGCETIWIVCPMGILPLLRYRLGDNVIDPHNYVNEYIRFKESQRRPIPIYYIAVHPRDKNKRDSVVWNILYGCRTVQKISGLISKKIIPGRYYICLPNVVYTSARLLKYRSRISTNRRFLISCNDKTILDGEPLACTINNTDIKILIKEFRDQATGMWDGSSPKRDGKWPEKRLSIDERYSGRFLTLKDVFSKLKPEENTITMKLDWKYNLDCWDGLCQYLGSEHRHKMCRPKYDYLRYREFKGVGIENV